jgi:lysozyme family protein
MTTTTPTQNFEKALTFTQKWEGGYVDHPVDPGGRTNFGITQATYDHWRRSKGVPLQNVKRIQPQEVKWIYWENYWTPAKCDLMVLHLAIAQFGTSVNFGVTGSVKFLQDVLNVGVDGIWGPITQAAFEKNNSRQTAIAIVEARIRYRHQRVAQNPTQKVFLQGWLNRDNALMGVITR